MLPGRHADPPPHTPQDEAALLALVAKLTALGRDEAAQQVAGLDSETAAAVLPSLKAGYCRAALKAMTPQQAGLTLEVMTPPEIAKSLAATARWEGPENRLSRF